MSLKQKRHLGGAFLATVMLVLPRSACTFTVQARVMCWNSHTQPLIYCYSQKMWIIALQAHLKWAATISREPVLLLEVRLEPCICQMLPWWATGGQKQCFLHIFRKIFKKNTQLFYSICALFVHSLISLWNDYCDSYWSDLCWSWHWPLCPTAV